MVWTMTDVSAVSNLARNVLSYVKVLTELGFPHNIACCDTSARLVIAVFARSPDPDLRGRKCIGVDVGCAEMCGDFTWYSEAAAAELSDDQIGRFLKETTVSPLVVRGRSAGGAVKTHSRL
eukprot:TRINITY_DN20722_c0_g1_i2.p1 TRINITY_DN20722_c0_g1~~TRINITY_DN20722_c0_g1_i2.p1  ORF type:complete len:121 (+),score=9.37 TRINITY_DN20722_c0_g1_i2:290-652(+)